MIAAGDAAIAPLPRGRAMAADSRLFAAAPMPHAAYAAPVAAVVPMRERVLLVVLFIAVLASSIAFIEPSPHDALMAVLGVACLVAGVRLNRSLSVLVFWLVIFNVAGLLSLIVALDIPKTIQYSATSVYLAIAAILFACLFSENTMARLATMRIAYVITAAIVGALGAAGYFHAFPGAQIFAPEGRALGTFKDPNVYGPFLIWPALFIIQDILTRRIRLIDLVALGCLLLGLLLSFSRGAWFHFAVSALIAVGLTFLTAPAQKTRIRIFGLSVLSVVLLAGALAVLFSIPAVQLMVHERVHLINSYDVGQGGRFRMQEMALSSVLQISQRHGAVRLRDGRRRAAAQSISAGVSGLRMGRRRRLHHAAAVDLLYRPAQRVPPHAVAALSDHGARRLHRRDGGRLHRRHRPLAPLLPAAWHDLGPRRGDDPQPAAGDAAGRRADGIAESGLSRSYLRTAT